MRARSLRLSQDRHRLAQVSERFRACSVLPSNFFGNRNMRFVAIEKGFDHESAMTCPCSNGVAIDKLNPEPAGLALTDTMNVSQ